MVTKIKNKGGGGVICFQEHNTGFHRKSYLNSMRGRTTSKYSSIFIPTIRGRISVKDLPIDWIAWKLYVHLKRLKILWVLGRLGWNNFPFFYNQKKFSRDIWCLLEHYRWTIWVIEYAPLATKNIIKNQLLSI